MRSTLTALLLFAGLAILLPVSAALAEEAVQTPKSPLELQQEQDSQREAAAKARKAAAAEEIEAMKDESAVAKEKAEQDYHIDNVEGLQVPVVGQPTIIGIDKAPSPSSDARKPASASKDANKPGR